MRPRTQLADVEAAVIAPGVAPPRRQRRLTHTPQFSAPAMAARLARRRDAVGMKDPETATALKVQVVRGRPVIPAPRLPVGTGRARRVQTTPEPVPVAGGRVKAAPDAAHIGEVEPAMAPGATLTVPAQVARAGAGPAPVRPFVARHGALAPGAPRRGVPQLRTRSILAPMPEVRRLDRAPGTGHEPRHGPPNLLSVVGPAAKAVRRDGLMVPVELRRVRVNTVRLLNNGRLVRVSPPISPLRVVMVGPPTPPEGRGETAT